MASIEEISHIIGLSIEKVTSLVSNLNVLYSIGLADKFNPANADAFWQYYRVYELHHDDHTLVSLCERLHLIRDQFIQWVKSQPKQYNMYKRVFDLVAISPTCCLKFISLSGESYIIIKHITDISFTTSVTPESLNELKNNALNADPLANLLIVFTD